MRTFQTFEVKNGNIHNLCHPQRTVNGFSFYSKGCDIAEGDLFMTSPRGNIYAVTDVSRKDVPMYHTDRGHVKKFCDKRKKNVLRRSEEAHRVVRDGYVTIRVEPWAGSVTGDVVKVAYNL